MPYRCGNPDCHSSYKSDFPGSCPWCNKDTHYEPPVESLAKLDDLWRVYFGGGRAS